MCVRACDCMCVCVLVCECARVCVFVGRAFVHVCVRECFVLLVLVHVRESVCVCAPQPLAAPPTIRNMSMVDLHNLAKMGASKSERPFPRITEFPPITHRSAISMSSVRIGFSQFMERADDDEPPTMD